MLEGTPAFGRSPPSQEVAALTPQALAAKKQSRKLNCYGVLCFMIGMLCILAAFATPYFVTRTVRSQAASMMELSKVNEPLWKDTLSGNGDVEFLR